MSRGAKGRIALVVLVSILVVSGVAIARSEPARVRFLAWRANASDPETRKKARLELLAIGRPAIDPVLADLFVGEVREQRRDQCIVVCARRSDFNELGGTSFVDYQAEVNGRIYGSAELSPVAHGLEGLPGNQRVVLLQPDAFVPRMGKYTFVSRYPVPAPRARTVAAPGVFVVVVSCPLDEATEARLCAEFGLTKR
jgi:hypothetical protein